MAHEVQRGRRLGWLGAELVVIAFAVAAGLAVDEWRQGRSDHVSELQYLKGLEADLAADSAEGFRQRNWADERAAIICATVDGLSDRSAMPNDTIVLQSIGWALNQSFLVLNGGTYQQLIAQGALDRVISRQIADSLRFYHDQVERLVGHITGWEIWRMELERYSMEILPPDGYWYAAGESRTSPTVGPRNQDVKLPRASSLRSIVTLMQNDNLMVNKLQRSCFSNLRVRSVHRQTASGATRLLAQIRGEINRVSNR